MFSIFTYPIIAIAIIQWNNGATIYHNYTYMCIHTMFRALTPWLSHPDIGNGYSCPNVDEVEDREHYGFHQSNLRVCGGAWLVTILHEFCQQRHGKCSYCNSVNTCKSQPFSKVHSVHNYTINYHASLIALHQHNYAYISIKSHSYHQGNSNYVCHNISYKVDLICSGETQPTQN